MATGLNTFSENVNAIAKLDNSIGYNLSLQRSNVVLNIGTIYSAVFTMSLYNRATNVTQTITVNGTDISANLNGYLASIKTAVETAYPTCVVTYSTVISGFTSITMSVELSGSGHYLRAMNITISEVDGIKYDIDGELVSPLEITPKMLDLTSDVIIAIDNISDNMASLDVILPYTANIATLAGSIANVNTIASIQNLDNMTVVANDLNAMDLNGIADVTVVANNLVLGATSSINIVSANKPNIDAVAANKPNIDTVAANIVGLGNINTLIVPNIAEILLADTNATTATTKANEASVSAAAALVSEQNTASLLDQFDDRYLGSKVVDPTLDNDGNALLEGAIYWNSVLVPARMRVYSVAGGWTDALTLSTDGAATLTNKVIDSITNTIGADHVHYKVRNASGATISIGTVVTAMGTQPGTDYIQVIPVTDPQAQVAIGIVHTTLLNNGTGLCVSRGVQDNTNTSAWPVNTILYPNTAGGFTTVKPNIGMYQACAYVLRQHVSSGTLLVNFIEPKTVSSTTQAGEVQLNNTLTSTSVVQALTAAQGKVLQDKIVADVDGLQVILDNKQPLDAGLTSISGLVTVADSMIYTTASDVYAVTTLTAAGRALIDDVDAEAQRTTLGISATNTPSTAVGGVAATNVQAAIQELDAEKVTGNVAIVAGTGTKITYDAKGLVTAGAVLVATDIPALDTSKLTTGTLPILRGGTGVTTSTGTGDVVLSTSPALVTPVLGVATGTSFNAITGLASVAPLINGTAAVGTSPLVARQDHVHPTDTNLAAVTTTVQKDSATGAATMPAGTTAQRKAIGLVIGDTRWNTTIGANETWNGSTWVSASGQMLGTALSKAISYNSQVINENITVPADVNFSMVGPVTVGDGYTVSISSGSRGVVL